MVVVTDVGEQGPAALGAVTETRVPAMLASRTTTARTVHGDTTGALDLAVCDQTDTRCNGEDDKPRPSTETPCGPPSASSGARRTRCPNPPASPVHSTPRSPV